LTATSASAEIVAMPKIEHTVRVSAPVEKVWEVISDHSAYDQWTDVKKATVRRPGSTDPNGVGAVRVFEVGGRALVEEVVAFSPPSFMAYKLTDGVPFLEHHKGEITPKRGTDETILTYTIDFDAKMGLGIVLKMVFNKAIGGMLKGLPGAVKRLG